MVQFLVRSRRGGGFDLYMRDLITTEDYRSRYLHLTHDHQMNHEEAAMELHSVVNKLFQKNEKPATLPMCERYIFDMVDPGDIIQIGKSVWVVMPPASA